MYQHGMGTWMCTSMEWGHGGCVECKVWWNEGTWKMCHDVETSCNRCSCMPIEAPEIKEGATIDLSSFFFKENELLNTCSCGT